MAKLTLELEDDYSLIALHSTEEDYRLAFLLNNLFGIKFTRFKYNLDFANSNAQFSMYEFKDEQHFLDYYLISNKDTHTIHKEEKSGLFQETFSTVSYLIPEKKTTDYFIKIEGDVEPDFIKNKIDKLNSLQQIITAYLIDTNNLKSKDHLIF